MYFLQPYSLLLLIFPILLFIYSLMSKKQTLESIFSADILKTICVDSHVLSTSLKYRLFLLTIILFIIALAQPITKHSHSSQTCQSVPLVIALDISKSMLKDDVYPNRLEFALLKIESIMKSNFNLRVGLLLFGDDAFVAHPLSEDKASLLFIAQSIDYSKIMQKSTNPFAALEGAQIMLKNYKKKNLLILSDIADINTKDFNLSVYRVGITPHHTYSFDDINIIMKKLQKESQTEDISGENKNTIQLFYFPLLLALLLLLFIYTYGLELKNRGINLIVSLIVLSFSTHSKASILDFYYLLDAKKSFEERRYSSALLSYKKLSKTQEVYYNIATTQYKLELYDKAIKNYEKSLGVDAIFNAKIYYNIANAYAKQTKLHLAKKYYKKSLLLAKDSDAQENLSKIKLILSNQKHKNSKEDKYKLPQRISIQKQALKEGLSSKYTVSLTKVVLNQEERLLKKLKEQKPIIYLQKLNITRRSKNVLQD
ncbi:MAG: VWA domain-containing protein [Sulfurimonas sp.]|nr:VWA domain-containing protein [Sulfurimonas sp.]